MRRRVYVTVLCPSVRLSVPAWAHSSKPCAAYVLLLVRQAGDIDRLLQQRRLAGACGQCHITTIVVNLQLFELYYLLELYEVYYK